MGNLERKPLPEELLERDPVLFLGREQISREELEQIEQIVVNQGLEPAIEMAESRSGILARMMGEKEAFAKFASHFPTKWKNALMNVLADPDPKFRAVALLLFLRTVCRNSRKVRRMLRQQTQLAQAA